MVRALSIVLNNGLGENVDSNVLHSSLAPAILVQGMVVFPFESWYDAIYVIHAVFHFYLTVVVVPVDDVASPMTSMKAVALAVSAHSTQ